MMDLGKAPISSVLETRQRVATKSMLDLLNGEDDKLDDALQYKGDGDHFKFFIQEVDECKTKGPDPFDSRKKLGCVEPKDVTGLPNGAEAQMPKAGSFRQQEKTWLRGTEGRYRS